MLLKPFLPPSLPHRLDILIKSVNHNLRHPPEEIDPSFLPSLPPSFGLDDGSV
jgi:hypothetical protein